MSTSFLEDVARKQTWTRQYVFRVFDAGEPWGFGLDEVVELWVEKTTGPILMEKKVTRLAV